MPGDEDLKEAIEENAKGPKRAKGDSGEVEQHDLAGQIEADRYLASKKAVKKKGAGVIFKKLNPPGTN